jgi:hypothetical protein
MVLNLLLAFVFAADEPATEAPAAEAPADSGSLSGSGSGSLPGSGSTAQGSFSVVAAAVHSGDHSGSAVSANSGTVPPQEAPAHPGTVPPQAAGTHGTIPAYPTQLPAMQKTQKVGVRSPVSEVPTQVIGKAKCTQCKTWNKKWICESCVKHISKHKGKSMKKKHNKDVICITQNGKKICGKKST